MQFEIVGTQTEFEKSGGERYRRNNASEHVATDPEDFCDLVLWIVLLLVLRVINQLHSEAMLFEHCLGNGSLHRDRACLFIVANDFADNTIT